MAPVVSLMDKGTLVAKHWLGGLTIQLCDIRNDQYLCMEDKKLSKADKSITEPSSLKCCIGTWTEIDCNNQRQILTTRHKFWSQF